MKNDLYIQTVSGNPALAALLQSRSVLLLQGPVGPFFDRLTHWLKGHGVATVNRAGEAIRHHQRLKTMSHSANVILVNSFQTKHAFESYVQQHHWPMPPIQVAPLAAAALPALSGRRLLEAPYFVMLGTIEARKNHLLMLQIWRDLVLRLGSSAPHLVLIGRRGWECEQVLDLLDRCDSLRNHIHEISNCPDEQMAIWVPFYAGWGLTTDKADFPASCLARRTRQLSLDELVAATLLRYPVYWDHDLKGVTTCMAVLLRIQAQRDALQAQGRLHLLKHGFWRRNLRKLKNWLRFASWHLHK